MPPAAKSTPEVKLRLPLQIGTSAAAFLARGGLVFLPAACVMLGAIFVFYELADSLGDIGGRNGVYVLVPALALFRFASLQMKRAWQARPSDVVLDADGLSIEGGVHHGLKKPWSELLDPPCRFTPGVASSEDEDRQLNRLLLVGKYANRFLPVAEAAPEAASFVEVQRTIAGARERALAEVTEAAPAARDSVARD